MYAAGVFRGYNVNPLRFLTDIDLAFVLNTVRHCRAGVFRDSNSYQFSHIAQSTSLLLGNNDPLIGEARGYVHALVERMR